MVAYKRLKAMENYISSLKVKPQKCDQHGKEHSNSLKILRVTCF